MSLQDKLDAYKKEFVKKVPADVLELMHGATEALRASGILDQTVKVGAKAPDFELQNIDDQPLALGHLLSKGSVVLGFYRGRW